MGRLTEYLDYRNNTKSREKDYTHLSITPQIASKRIDLTAEIKEELMKFYMKKGYSKEEWAKIWERELKHRIWSHEKVKEHKEQLSIFEQPKEENEESK